MSSVSLRIPAPHSLRNTSLSDCWQGGKNAIAITVVLDWDLSKIVAWKIGMKEKWRQSILFLPQSLIVLTDLGLPGPASEDCDCRNIDFAFMSTEILRDKLCRLNECSWVPEAYGIQPRVLKELADITVGTLSIILRIWGGPCWLGDVIPMLANVIPGYKKGMREYPGNYRVNLRTWKNY